MSNTTIAGWISDFVDRHSDGCYCSIHEDTLGQGMAELADLVRAEQAAEIEPLQADKFQSARQFLESRYPEISGPGWLRRDNLRAWVVEFLKEWEAAEKGVDGE